MKKSCLSRKGSLVSLLTAGHKDEPTLQLMRISIKKQTQRKQKLQKLLARYQLISSQQKHHTKSIKASIIELKDNISVAKIHYLIDPNIYVNNNLSIQTRQFLCTLLNTFYKRYEQNKQFQQTSKKLTQNVSVLLKKIQNNQQLLIKKQRSTINEQVQLQGQLFSQKNKLKQYNMKNKEVQAQNNRIKAIWQVKKGQYQVQKKKYDALKAIQQQIQSKIIGLNNKIHMSQQIKQGNRQKISGQMAYHSKVQEQINYLKDYIAKEMKRQKMLKKKIKEMSMKNSKIKGLLNYDNNIHQVEMKLLDIQKPRLSAKVEGIATILEIQKTFAKNMSQIWNQKDNSTKFSSVF